MSQELAELTTRLHRLRSLTIPRADDRRTGRSPLRFPERRTGFDRRLAHIESHVARARESLLLSYRDRTLVLASVLILANVANVADLVMTLRALSLGAVEANPVMAAALSMGPVDAGIFKVGLLAAITLVIWMMRRYRSMLVVSIGLAAAFAAVMVYQVWLAAAAA